MSDWGEIKTNWKTDFVARTDKKTEKSGLEDLQTKKYDDYFEKTYQIIREINIELPKQNQTTFILTMKSFSSLGLIDFIIKQIGTYPEKMILYIYSLNSNIAKRINEISEQTNETKIVLSDLQN
jgi:hypothetical protein